MINIPVYLARGDKPSKCHSTRCAQNKLKNTGEGDKYMAEVASNSNSPVSMNATGLGERRRRPTLTTAGAYVMHVGVCLSAFPTLSASPVSLLLPPCYLHAHATSLQNQALISRSFSIVLFQAS